MGLQMAERKGLEPSASGVTGRRYNRLNYRSKSYFPKSKLFLHANSLLQKLCYSI